MPIILPTTANSDAQLAIFVYDLVKQAAIAGGIVNREMSKTMPTILIDSTIATEVRTVITVSIASAGTP